jgi:acylphosphatase
MTDSAARVLFVVTGRVQGVGFRVFVQREAVRLGLLGWVRNLGWNQVEGIAEGARPQVEQFVEVLRRGPAVSRVEECSIKWEPVTGEFVSFEIRSSR